MIWNRLLVCAAAGALLSATLPPLGMWPLLLALVPLFVFTALASRPGEAFWLGFAFGLPFFTLYVLWLPRSFASPEFFGSFFWLLYPPLLLILAAFWGLVTFLARVLGGGGPVTLWLLPPLWILMEWARTQGYLAFPWGTLGYAWLDTPPGQLADTVGVWGLGLLTTGLAALIAVPFVPGRRIALQGRAGPAWRSWLALPAALVLLAAGWLAGSAKLQRPLPEPDMTALLVQGNLDPFGRVSGPVGELEVQAGLTANALEQAQEPPEIVIWPEGAVLSGLTGSGGAARLQEIQDSSPQSAFLVGARTNEGNESFNSAYSIDDGEIIDRYDKNYLVPFGERFPFAEAAAPLYRAVFGLFGLSPLASTTPGDELQPLTSPLGELGTYICYESVFPQVQQSLVSQGAGVLVNITNDAWFSRGDGAQQHYDMGRMRAIETRRYILRSGLDGITGVVDPLGRSVEQLPRGARDTLLVDFAMSDEITPYVRYGGWLLPLLGLWILGSVLTRFSSR